MIKNSALVLTGAILGAYVGHLAVGWMWSHGYYAMILPGGLAGLGAGIAKSPSRTLPFLCAAIGVVATLYSEWQHFPFVADASAGYFVAHLSDLRPMTLIDVVIGALIAFYVPYSRAKDARKIATA